MILGKKNHTFPLKEREELDRGTITMFNELRRKFIHLCSISIPIAYVFVTKGEMLWVLVPLLAVSIIVETLRFTIPKFNAFFLHHFSDLMRDHEVGAKPKLSGATFVLLSAVICVAFFPKVIAITGFAILIVSDIAAALIGRKYGKRRFLEKSVEGSFAFFVTAVIIVFVVSNYYSAGWSFILAGICAAVIATVTEAKSYGINIDDNLTIPLSFGAAMWALLLLFSHASDQLLLHLK